MRLDRIWTKGCAGLAFGAVMMAVMACQPQSPTQGPAEPMGETTAVTSPKGAGIGPFPEIPLAARETVVLMVHGPKTMCHGMLGHPFACLDVTMPDGRRGGLMEGILGYEHDGREKRVAAEKITYQVTHRFPADASTVWYIFQGGVD